MTFTVCAAILLILLFFVPARHLHPLIRIFARLILLSCGQILLVSGEKLPEGDGPFIYMFNHESFFDVFMVGSIVPHYVTAVAARYQFDIPLWGALLRRYGIIPIDRQDLTSAIASLDQAEAAIREGRSFFISPEGTRTLDGIMGQFKKGAFHVALNTRATIIPLGFTGGFRAKPKFRRYIAPGILRAHVGQPIGYADYRKFSVDELRDFTRRKFQDLLN